MAAIPGISVMVVAAAAFAAAFCASSRAPCAETASQIPTGSITPTAMPAKRANSFSRICEELSSRSSSSWWARLAGRRVVAGYAIVGSLLLSSVSSAP